MFSSRRLKFGIYCLVSIVIMLMAACDIPQPTADFSFVQMTQTVMAIAGTQTAMSVVSVPQNTVEAVIDAPTSTPQPSATPEPTQTPTATPIVHVITPSEPGWVSRWFNDTNSSSGAANKSAPGGEDWYQNFLERPFTATDMIYRPDVDINRVEISHDQTFFFFIITVNGVNAETNALNANYGIELDLELNGRGDYLIICQQPASSTWQVEPMLVYKDGNEDVGGKHPSSPEAPYQGDGYDQTIFSLDVMSDPDAAWCRVKAGSSNVIQIAVKRSLLGNPNYFAYGAWADGMVQDQTRFEYNDYFTYAQAGSPYAVNSDYPLKELALVDNTCREFFGAEPTGEIPSACRVVEEPTPQPTAVQNGSFSGKVFEDKNSNGRWDSGEPVYGYPASVTYASGTCAAPTSGWMAVSLSATKTFSKGNLAPGAYCVKISPTTSITTPSQYNITIPAGGNVYIEFGYYIIY